jgi:hypothetical protein
MLLFLLLIHYSLVAWSYLLVTDYSGSSFFDKWDFYGSYDNLTLGECH